MTKIERVIPKAVCNKSIDYLIKIVPGKFCNKVEFDMTNHEESEKQH